MNYKIRAIILITFDICIMILSGLFSFLLLKLDGDVYFKDTLILIGINVIAIECLFIVFGVYKGIIKYTGIHEGSLIVIAIIALLTFDILVNIVFSLVDYRWIVVTCMIYFLFAFGGRTSYRFINHLKNEIYSRRPNDKKRVMIIGAGAAGAALVREINNTTSLNMRPVCFIDDDISKQNKEILGIPVIGYTKDIIKESYKNNITNIIVAIPSADQKRIVEIYNICKETPCQIQTLPGLYQLIDGTSSLLGTIRDVDVNDLLGREPIKVNIDEIMSYIENEVVIITGGSGSIGSEISRQVAKHHPKLLIIFDIYENTTYNLELELRRDYIDLNLLTLIGSVRSETKLENVFKTYKPTIVFHAAAHKHVPLMETSPCEAIKNNVFGTLNVAKMANKYSSKKMVLISTDKAVNPTSLMGASKRICEMIVQTMNESSKTCEYVAVRFGNVLGSNGSVIPIFTEQIKKGGPVTVTDKNMVRYFMTIPEAVSLVLQAGAYAKGGEIFVLDMGEPVKIYDLAVNLIKLSGYQPDIDIKIEICGLRPGEKMYEETLMKEEGLMKTANKLIYIGKPLEIDREILEKSLEELYKASYDEVDKDVMKQIVSKLVKTYKITNN